VAGLTLLGEPDPLGAHTAGLGELIRRALDLGATRVVVALGGSASTDGGTGALAALGARFLDAGGRELPRGGGALADLAAADLSALRAAPRRGVTCLADVRAPLLGPGGAAAVFAPQKGADRAQVDRLAAGLARLAAVLGGRPGAPGAGAAGGTGYGLAAGWGARLAPGAAEVARIAGLAGLLRSAGLVITGEGQYDATSLTGKVVGTVCAEAGRAGVPVALVAGRLAAPVPDGVWRAVELAELAGGAGLAGGTAAAMSEPARWLRLAGRRLAESLAPGCHRPGDLPAPASGPPAPGPAV
jgi:glycerate kinase